MMDMDKAGPDFFQKSPEQRSEREKTIEAFQAKRLHIVSDYCTRLLSEVCEKLRSRARGAGSPVFDSAPIIGTYKMGIEGIIGTTVDGRKLTPKMRVVTVANMCMVSISYALIGYGVMQDDPAYKAIGGSLYGLATIPHALAVGNSWWHGLKSTLERLQVPHGDAFVDSVQSLQGIAV